MAAITLHNIAWDDFLKLRDDPAHDHLRMNYLDGNLSILSPQLRHDRDSFRLYEVVRAVALAKQVDLLVIGTTTLRRHGRTGMQGASKEPDQGFYLGADEALVRDNDEIDLTIDPPPTLAIEVDNTSDSEDALPTYARIGVPEVWRFSSKELTLWFGRLVGEGYVELDRSVSLPWLTPAQVLEALQARQTLGGDRPWFLWLEGWARGLAEVPQDQG
jgi:Uma2 family endonuclease